MANPKIEVEIGAIIDPSLTNSISKAESGLKGLSTASASTSAKINNLKQATSNYNGVGIEFSRIIQDAPFGIIGVGNNITQLASSFQNLRAQSTSTGAALKTALASIISPANLLVLGISAVTTAFTLYSMGAFKSKDATKELKSETDLYKESLNKLLNSLNAVNSARLESNIDSEKEISRIDLLKSAIEDESKSRESRLAAFSTLKNLYPSILGNIDAEKVLINGLSKEYGILTAAIFERASASAIESEVGKIATERVKLLQKENSETSFQNKLLNERESIISKIKSLQKEVGKGFSGEAEQTAINRLKGELTVVNAELETLGVVSSKTNDELLKNKASTDSLKEAYTGLNQELISSLNPIENVSTSVEKLTTEFEKSNLELLEFQDSLKAVLTLGAIKGLQDFKLPDAKPLIQDIGINIGNGPPVIEIPQIDESSKTATLNSLKDFGSQAGAILESGIENLIGDLAFNIGATLSSGGDVLKVVGKTLLSGIAGILDALGKAAIEIGVGMIAIKLAFKNPATAIAAGIGLIALAGFISAKVGGATSGIGGGGGGNSVGAGVSGQTFGGSGFSSNAMNLNGEFIVRGTDLVYVLNRVQDKNAKG